MPDPRLTTRVRERLPYGDRRDVGGGIAMAVTAVAALALWIGGVTALLLVADSIHPWFLLPVLLGTLASPLGTFAAFTTGTVAWRYGAPTDAAPRRGAVLGATTAIATLALVACGAIAAYIAWAGFSYYGFAPATVAIVAVKILRVAPFAIAFALFVGGWFVAPVGALGGWWHERGLERAPANGDGDPGPRGARK